MTPNSPQAQSVRAAIEELIQLAAKGELDILDTLYHDDMQIYMLDEKRELHIMNKPGFTDFLKASVKDGNYPNPWAEFHLVEADEKNGHVVISRKANLTEEGKIISLSIDFVFEDGRWQITREVIFAG